MIYIQKMIRIYQMNPQNLSVKVKGQVETPVIIAQFMLKILLGTYHRELSSKRILDPGCGNGIFLQIVIEKYIDDFLSCNPSDIALSTLNEQLEKNFIGLEIDENRVTITKEKLNALYQKKTQSHVFPNWQIINSDYLNWNLDGKYKFDFIISNPPYVRLENIDKTKIEILKQNFKTAQQRFDVYQLFLENSINQLKEGGRLCYILPNRFKENSTGRSLREIITRETKILKFFDFVDCSIFKGFTTYPSIIYLEKGTNHSTSPLFSYTRISGATEPELATLLHSSKQSQRVNTKMTSFLVNQDQRIEQHFKFVEPKLRDILETIHQNSTPLNQFVSRISAGTATGLDSVFLLNDEQIQGLEEELLVPTIKGRAIRNKAIKESKLWFLLPFKEDNNGKTHLIEEKELRLSYPNIYAHLIAHRVKLEKRTCVTIKNKQWYDFHESVDMRIMRTNKIIFPDIANEVSFVIDDLDNYHVSHSVYYLIPKTGSHLRIIEKILNHRFFEVLIKLSATKQKNGYYRFQSQFIKKLPFIREQILDKVDENTDIDSLIQSSFGLTHEEFTFFIAAKI